MNLKIVNMDLLNFETVKQYQYEERTLIARRYKSAHPRTKVLLEAMYADEISTEEKTTQLKQQLAEFHKNNRFLGCHSMGEIVAFNIEACLSIIGSI